MKHQVVGYIRVSSVGQNTDRQLAGVALDRVFEEKASAKTVTARPVLAECLAYVRAGDTLVCHSLDRLARNTAELLGLVREITGKGVTVRFLKENLTFSGSDDDPFKNLMLSMLAAFGQFERELINERRREGVAAARARGRKFGAPAKLTPELCAKIDALLASGASKRTTARAVGIGEATLYRYLHVAATAG
ncbi:recombinase family protein [Methylococcus geothermalis]|uniref:Helix-turn-helix domain-containing protein n=1 Tax=Methylococcus geothermalis TaxID=2681310 RepID=A0A858QBL6_9GAMM|nr:recombinase family protein [Methylococcus geothermalis]QJD31190.1 helix-turn-helix domain-containing protein [Methylococcus geothermalis]